MRCPRYVDAILRKEALSGQHDSVGGFLWALLKYYGPKARIHILVLFLVLFGIVLSCNAVKWTFLDGLYFSVTSLCTAGLHPLPEDSANWVFMVVGIFVAIGAPIVAVSVSLFAASVANIGALDKLERVVNTVITEEELQVLSSLGLENGNVTVCRVIFH